MKNYLFAIILTFICVLLNAFNMNGQDRNFSLTLEYVPNFNKVTDPLIKEGIKFNHHALARVSYLKLDKIKPSIGFGLFHVGFYDKINGAGNTEIDEVVIKDNYYYVIIPFGIKYNLKRFYILPEIAICTNIVNGTSQKIKYKDGSSTKESWETRLNSGEFNRLSIPVSLNVGYEFTVGKLILHTGLKAYYGVNQIIRDVPRNNHYYGFGLVFGVTL